MAPSWCAYANQRPLFRAVHSGGTEFRSVVRVGFVSMVVAVALVLAAVEKSSFREQQRRDRDVVVVATPIVTAEAHQRDVAGFGTLSSS